MTAEQAPSPAWVAAQYDNRARVPAASAHLAHWTEASARARATLPAHLDLAYGAGPDDRLDLFPAPGGTRQAPVLVFLHGGYWRALGKADHAFIAPALVAAGVCVVVPEYSLCPGPPEAPVTIAGITAQVARATAWVWRHVAAFGGDPANVTLAGHSAGGQLAGALLTWPWQTLAPDLPATLTRKAVSISGLHDLAPLRHWAALQAAVGLTDAEVAACSPARRPPPAVGTLHAWVGGDESEEFHRQAHLLRAAWGPDRVPVCEALPGRHHFTALEALADPTTRLFQETLRLAHAPAPPPGEGHRA
ncbi:MAG: alpha/beta hydrolase [Candidatus Sericytochromatia bacterium]|nr:alpha/beta hydrolase [Candidatus Sericytochromatia bacterium]